VYASLNVRPTVTVTPETTKGLWDRAVELRPERKTSQGCWVSFVQDMAPCILRENLGRKWESGDRVPEDLTVAPVQVDIITVALLCVAAGMKFSRYSPATGEIGMSGEIGAITSAVHPVLGGLMHYTPGVLATTDESLEEMRMHSRAVNQGKGVWANAVFGKFNDRGIGRGFLDFTMLQRAIQDSMPGYGWLRHEGIRAAGFMALATVDVYIVTPPTCIHSWCAHFAEVIVKAHLNEIQGREPVTYPPDFPDARASMIENHGASSPHIPWDQLDHAHLANTIPDFSKSPIEPLQPLNLVTQDLLSCGTNETEDPSQFVTSTAAWEVIMNADAASHALEKEVPGIRDYSNHVVAASIIQLGDAPSLDRATAWPQDVLRTCRTTSADENFPPEKQRQIFAHAKLSMLRASYLTIMLKAAGSVGPGLARDSELVTGLAYMA